MKRVPYNHHVFFYALSLSFSLSLFPPPHVYVCYCRHSCCCCSLLKLSLISPSLRYLFTFLFYIFCLCVCVSLSFSLWWLKGKSNLVVKLNNFLKASEAMCINYNKMDIVHTTNTQTFAHTRNARIVYNTATLCTEKLIIFVRLKHLLNNWTLAVELSEHLNIFLNYQLSQSGFESMLIQNVTSECLFVCYLPKVLLTFSHKRLSNYFMTKRLMRSI